MAEFDYTDDQNDFEDTLANTPPAQEGFFSRNTRLIIGTLIATIILGGGYYMFFKSPSPKELTAKQKAMGMQNSTDKLEEAQKKEQKEAKSNKNKKIKYIKLYDLNLDDASHALKELSISGIPFTTEQKGKNFSLSIDEKRLEEAKSLLAIKGIPGGNNKGYELLDNSQTLGVTEFDKRIRFVRALSGELEKAILQFDMIETAKVQIVLPEQRLFAVTQPPVTASVLIRKFPGTEITDDVVFSIIQLVANAVENLQPENVSVIDTEGHVLSNGIFERLAARDSRNRPSPVRPSENLQLQQDAAIGTPVIPNFEDIKRWQEVKQKFEATLQDRATEQLIGVLPEGSFKIAINADLGPLENGEIVDIKRLTTSVIVDNSRQDIFLEPLLKKQIFNTIASAIGYVKGRDTIQLNRADFRLLSQSDQNKLANKQKFKKILGSLAKVAPYVIGGGGSIGLSYALYRFLKKRLKNFKLPSIPELPEDEARETDFGSLQNEMNSETQINRLKDIASSRPDELATLIETWMNS